MYLFNSPLFFSIPSLKIRQMPISPKKITAFTFFKLPSVFWLGIRVKTIDDNCCTVRVKHRWISQNPFKSLFWAVQGMAAELSTGAMVMSCIKDSDKKISMLVANNKATFLKKATGKINFTCNNGQLIKKVIDDAIVSGEGQTCWMKSEGVNEDGIVVSVFEFEWTLKVKP
jgi:hypothetical protein